MSVTCSRWWRSCGVSRNEKRVLDPQSSVLPVILCNREAVLIGMFQNLCVSLRLCLYWSQSSGDLVNSSTHKHSVQMACPQCSHWHGQVGL